jgi:hypothetical protein
LSYRLPAAGPVTLFVTDGAGSAWCTRSCRTAQLWRAIMSRHGTGWTSAECACRRVLGALRTARHMETRRLVMLGGR